VTQTMALKHTKTQRRKRPWSKTQNQWCLAASTPLAAQRLYSSIN